MAEERRATFYFGPRSRRGLVAGLRSGQLAVVATTLIVTVLWIHAGRGPSCGVGAVVLCAVGFGTAFWPVAGRTIEEWLPVGARFVALRLSGRHLSSLPPSVAQHNDRSPVPFGGLRVCASSAQTPAPAFGISRDDRSGVSTVVLAVEGGPSSPLGSNEQIQRAHGWAMVLAAAAQEVPRLHRVQWIERAIPQSADSLVEHFQKSGTASRSHQRVLDEARQSYARLLDSEANGAVRHETLVALSVLGPRRRKRASRDHDGDGFTAQLLETEASTLAARLADAGLTVQGLLSADALRIALRRSFDVRPSRIGARQPWPVAVAANWSSLCTDGTWHATYWVAEWPRTEVNIGFLAPLLVGCRERRTVSVIMRPVTPTKAARSAERDHTAQIADEDLRRRHGFLTTARTERQHAASLRREGELAEGHSAYQFSGYVTVTAADRVELERSCARVEQSAAAARLELCRLYGMQAEAFTYSLPFGRGCG